MSIVTVSYNLSSIEGFLGRLGRVALSDSVKRAVADGMLAATVKSFESEQAPNGAAWTMLAQSTLRKKKGRGSILRDSGLMFSTMRPFLNNGDPSVIIGEGIPDARAVYAQKGTSREPRRPYFPENEQASDTWWSGVTKPVRDAWSAAR